MNIHNNRFRLQFNKMRLINRKFCGLLTANYSTRIIQKTTVRLSTASDGERPDHGKGRKQGTIGIKQRFESIMETECGQKSITDKRIRQRASNA